MAFPVDDAYASYLPVTEITGRHGMRMGPKAPARYTGGPGHWILTVMDSWDNLTLLVLAFVLLPGRARGDRVFPDDEA